MAFKAFRCPSCHALIETFDETTKKGFCPFCDALILDVQERQLSLSASERGAVRANGADFVIRGGVLVKYNGEGVDVVVPDNVVCVGKGAFSELKGIKSVVLPEGVEEIGLAAFTHCTRLESVVLPSTLTTIEYAAFDHCEALRRVVIPRSVKTLANSAFEYCFGLKEVLLPEGLISIGNRAFLGCVSLSSITLPSSLQMIGSSAFSYCLSLSEMTIPKELSFERSGMICCSDYDGQDVDPIPGEEINWISGHSIAWTPLLKNKDGVSETSTDFISSHSWRFEEGVVFPSPIRTLYFKSEDFANTFRNYANDMLKAAANRAIKTLTADKFPRLVLLK